MRVRGSRFIGIASHAVSEAEAAAVVSDARKQWHDARHHCYAFRVGKAAEVFRANDDGEPGGTAGIPILRQIESRELTQTVVVVTRYFGGTKLGRGGLTRAYSDAAGLALDASEVRHHVITCRYRVSFPYGDTARAMRAIERFGASVVSSEYSEAAALVVEIRRSAGEAFRAGFEAQLAGRGTVRLLPLEDSD